MKPPESNRSAIEERLNELEIKAAFQEQLISELNEALTAESGRVNELRSQLVLLQQRLDSNPEASTAQDAPEPPPPHY